MQILINGHVSSSAIALLALAFQAVVSSPAAFIERAGAVSTTSDAVHLHGRHAALYAGFQLLTTCFGSSKHP